jgi:hypothetical protein
MTAKAPTRSTVAVRMINRFSLLAAAGPKAYRFRFFVVQNETTVNAQHGRVRSRKDMSVRLIGTPV